MSVENEMKQQILSARYFKNGETTYDELCHRVADFVGNNDQERDMFYKMMISDEFLPNSPTLMNAGRPNPFMSACVVLPIDDTLNSIFTTIKNTALIHQCGGGTGFSFTKLRPEGAFVNSSEGKASGPISFMTVFDRATSVVSQGGCFTGDTPILTADGVVKISELKEGMLVYSYDKARGFVLKPCSAPFRTIQNASVVEVKTDKGVTFKATPNHPIMNRYDMEYTKLEDMKIGHPVMPVTIYTHNNYMTLTLHDGNDTRVPLHMWLMKEAGLYVDGMFVHHKDGNRFNNIISNLQCIEPSEHAKLHGQIRYQNGEHPFLKITKEQIDKRARNYSKYWASLSDDEKFILKRKNSEAIKLENKCRYANGTHNFINNHPSKQPELVSIANKSRIANTLWKLMSFGEILDETTYPILLNKYDIQKMYRFKISTILKEFGSFENALKYANDRNHKIISIVPIEQHFDVWNVEVTDTHNYVVCNESGTTGIVVSNSRRGANLGCIKVDHPDILKFIDCKAVEGNISNFNISVMITDDFMQYVRNGDMDTVFTKSNDGQPITVGEIWNSIVKHAWNNGEPGVLFYDTFNKFNGTPVTGSIESTNPCVTGDTMILTRDGYKRIDSLVDVECEIWNGLEWSKVVPRITGHDEKISEVVFSNGRSIVCTNYHTWYIGDGRRVHTSELKLGDMIAQYSLPVFNGNEQLSAAYIYGRFCADHSKDKTLSFMEFIKSNADVSSGGWGNASSWEDPQQQQFCSSFLPGESYSLLDRIAFGIGFKDAFVDKSSLKACDTIIIDTNDADRICRFYELIGVRTTKLSEHSVQLNVVDIDNLETLKREIINQSAFEAPRVFVSDVIPRGVAETVYCLTEPKRHMFIANGILTGNCGEQGLLPYESCTLGSINLTKFLNIVDGELRIDYKSLAECVCKAVLFLDNVVEKNVFPIPELEIAANKTRKIGLGVMGWADTLIMLGIPYNSLEAVDLGEYIMRMINYYAMVQSAQLADDRGAFDDWDINLEYWNSVNSDIMRPYPYDVNGVKYRNASITTVAPTGTISILAGCSSGIEPNFSYVYKRKNVIGKEFMVIHPLFESELKRLCKTDADYDEIIQYMYEHGSIQNCNNPVLTDKFKRIFVTAMDVSGYDHISMQAAFQKHVTSSISKTINLPESTTEEEVGKLILIAHEKGCKGLTLYRTNSRKNVVLNLAETKTENTKMPDTITQGIATQLPVGFAERPTSLTGTTYLVHSGCCDLYVTVNSYDGRVFETFVRSTGTGGCDANTNAMGRFISAWLRKGLDPNELIHSLNKVVCPACIRNKNSDGKSCAGVICKCISLESNKLLGIVPPANPQFIETERKVEQIAENCWICPDCGEKNIETGGCRTCKNCGYSKCG